MFNKNKKEEKTKSLVSDFDDSDIFADFSSDKKLNKEVEEFKSKEKRDGFDILNIFSQILKTINLLLFIVVFVGFGYVYLQKNEAFSDSAIIDPICFIFVGEDNIKANELCSSVSYTSNFYKNKVNELKSNQFKKITNVLGDLYKSENFTNSKEVTFLKDNLEKRLKPTEIISEFNKLLADFNGNKTHIVCENLSINSNSVLEANCKSYINGWIDPINGTNMDDRSYFGTSMSLTISFLNYITKSNSNFSLLEKQKDFSSESASGSLGDTMTSFNLKLRYNNNSL